MKTRQVTESWFITTRPSDDNSRILTFFGTTQYAAEARAVRYVG